MNKFLLVSITFLVAQFSFAQTFNYNGINYNVTNTTNFYVEVGVNSSFSGLANIPATVVYNSQNYTVTAIGNQAFQNCSGLTSITIANSVTSIGDYTFASCTGLTSINVPNSVTAISAATFFNCTNLTSVTIPNSVTTLGNSAFEGCSGLTSVTIPNSVTTLNPFVFYNCYGLTSVTIPNSVITINSYAFGECTGLTSFTIPNSVTAIGDNALNNCTGLTSLTIGDSVTYIGNYAFRNCTGLTTVNSYRTSPLSINANIFQNVNQSNCALHVPAGSETAYQNAAVWQDFAPLNGSLLANTSFTLNNKVKMFPNPTSDFLTVDLEANYELQSITFYNQLGQVVKSATTATTNVSDLAKGNYFVEVQTNNGIGVKQIIIK